MKIGRTCVSGTPGPMVLVARAGRLLNIESLLRHETRLVGGLRTTDVTSSMVLGVLRIETRRIPTSTGGVLTIAPVENVRAIAGIGRPREAARLGTAGTIPGRATRNGVVGTMGPMSPTPSGIGPGEVHAAFRRIPATTFLH